MIMAWIFCNQVSDNSCVEVSVRFRFLVSVGDSYRERLGGLVMESTNNDNRRLRLQFGRRDSVNRCKHQLMHAREHKARSSGVHFSSTSTTRRRLTSGWGSQLGSVSFSDRSRPWWY